jgi:5-formyltetrahydrofolate cyclo-ligase
VMQSKEEIRQKVWSVMQREKVARFPGAQGRIPNFAGAEVCARLLAEKFYWKRARFLKANPDSPQRAIRHKALAEGKIVYMAVPRLRDEKPFIELDPAKLNCSPYTASSIQGAAKFGKLIGLDGIKKIDLIICGSVAVNRGGARVGKGGGYSDLEFALLTDNKKISAKTPIVTSVHALQIFDEDLPMTSTISRSAPSSLRARSSKSRRIFHGRKGFTGGSCHKRRSRAFQYSRSPLQLVIR